MPSPRFFTIFATRAATVAFSLLVAACSGGGGGSSPAPGGAPATLAPVQVASPPSVGATPAPTAPPSSTATATPTPAPAASPLSISGKVVNRDTAATLPGAVVYVSHKLQTTDTAPMAAPADGGEVTTAADGTYAMTLPAQGAYPSTFFVNVYSPGKVTVHNELTVTASGVNQIRDLGETTLTSDEAGWLALVNQDRAKYGRSVVYTDETTQEIARLWAAYLAKGHYQHTCPTGDATCPDKNGYATSQFATFVQTGENLAAISPASTYKDAETGFMAEAANCPQPANPDTCPFAENTGHFINIENQNVVWFGMAEAFGGLDYQPNSTAKIDYYVQELSLPNKSGFTVNSKFRTVAPLP